MLNFTLICYGQIKYAAFLEDLLIRSALLEQYSIEYAPGQLSQYSDWLPAGRFGDRVQIKARFSAPVQTGPGPHPTSYTMGTGSFVGLKQRKRSIHHIPHLGLSIKKGPSGPSWPVVGLNLPFTRKNNSVCIFLQILYGSNKRTFRLW